MTLTASATSDRSFAKSSLFPIGVGSPIENGLSPPSPSPSPIFGVTFPPVLNALCNKAGEPERLGSSTPSLASVVKFVSATRPRLTSRPSSSFFTPTRHPGGALAPTATQMISPSTSERSTPNADRWQSTARAAESGKLPASSMDRHAAASHSSFSTGSAGGWWDNGVSGMPGTCKRSSTPSSSLGPATGCGVTKGVSGVAATADTFIRSNKGSPSALERATTLGVFGGRSNTSDSPRGVAAGRPTKSSAASSPRSNSNPSSFDGVTRPADVAGAIAAFSAIAASIASKAASAFATASSAFRRSRACQSSEAGCLTKAFAHGPGNSSGHHNRQRQSDDTIRATREIRATPNSTAMPAGVAKPKDASPPVARADASASLIAGGNSSEISVGLSSVAFCGSLGGLGIGGAGGGGEGSGDALSGGLGDGGGGGEGSGDGGGLRRGGGAGGVIE